MTRLLANKSEFKFVLTLRLQQTLKTLFLRQVQIETDEMSMFWMTSKNSNSKNCHFSTDIHVLIRFKIFTNMQIDWTSAYKVTHKISNETYSLFHKIIGICILSILKNIFWWINSEITSCYMYPWISKFSEYQGTL